MNKLLSVLLLITMASTCSAASTANTTAATDRWVFEKMSAPKVSKDTPTLVPDKGTKSRNDYFTP